MVPTARAIEIERVARRLVDDYARLVQPVSAFNHATSSRRFSVSAPEVAERLLIPPLVHTMRSGAPDVRLCVRAPDPDRSFAMLENGELDVRIAWLTSPFRSLRSMPLFEDRLVCLVCARRRDIGATMTTEQFLAMPHAVGYGHATTTRILEEAMARHKRSLAQAFLVQNMQTLPHLLLGNEVVAILPELLAREYEAQYSIRIVEVPLRLPPVRYAAYWHERNQRDEGHKWFRGELVKAGRGLTQP